MCNIEENMLFKNQNEINDFLHGKKFRCVESFLSWMTVGELYTISHLNGSDYTILGMDGISGKASMSQRQLLLCFVPVDIETDFSFALTYVWWLCEKTGGDRFYIDSLLGFYVKTVGDCQ